MALEMTYKLGGDTPITAYVRIRRVTIEYDPEKANLLSTGKKYVALPYLEIKSGKTKNVLETWCNEQTFIFAYDHTSNDSAIKQAYIFLKSLPEFSSSIDIND